MPPLAALPIADTPVAILDFETTGLHPGSDRVVEVAVVRVDPGCAPRLVLDTLVNPRRPMACTEVHGISDADVADAPEYQRVCHDRALHTFGDLAQLRSYKFCESFDWEPLLFKSNETRPRLKSRRAGSTAEKGGARIPPEALSASSPSRQPQERRAPLPGWRTTTPPLSKGGPGGVASPGDRVPTPHDRPPSQPTPHSELPTPRSAYALRQYWEALKLVLSDLEISDGELEYIERKKRALALTDEEIRVQHARAFASVIGQFADDQRLDDHECRKLNRLHRALARLGWAPGQ